MASQLAETLQVVFEELRSLGFRKRAGSIFTCELGDDILGWVGLNRATQGRAAGSASVNPVIGLRHQEVQKVVAELDAEKYHPYLPPTVSSPIGYIMPERRLAAWEVTPSTATIEARNIGTAVSEWGLPFMRENSDLRAILRLADQEYGIPDSLRYTRPVARALSGDRVGASEDVAASLLELAPHAWPAAVRFRSFAARFEEWNA